MIKRREWTDREWEHCLNCFALSRTTQEAVTRHRRRYKRRTEQSIRAKFTTEGLSIVDSLAKSLEGDEIEETLENTKLRSEIALLRKDLSDTKLHAISGQKIMDFIHDLKNAKFKTRPDWLKGAKKKAATLGIPVLFLSDLHFDELVDPEQISDMNMFNHDIAIKRIKYAFEKAVDLLINHMQKPSYEGIVIPLGGDLLSGNIHEELSETNEAPVLQSAIDLTEIMVQGIKGMADVFGKVFVPCVIGNHGRIHKKPRAKNRAKDNYEWLVYHNIAKAFVNDDRVTFYIPESTDALFSIYGLNFLLSHGDQFKGGSGISGMFTPLMLGFSRKQKKQQAVGKPFDIMMIAHWHQYIHTESIIVNGSVKGYDEFASMHNFPYERPKQALFIVHPKLGVTYRVPIICDAYDGVPMAEYKKKAEIL